MTISHVRLWLPSIWIDANAQVEDAADLVGRRPAS